MMCSHGCEFKIDCQEGLKSMTEKVTSAWALEQWAELQASLRIEANSIFD